MGNYMMQISKELDKIPPNIGLGFTLFVTVFAWVVMPLLCKKFSFEKVMETYVQFIICMVPTIFMHDTYTMFLLPTVGCIIIAAIRKTSWGESAYMFLKKHLLRIVSCLLSPFRLMLKFFFTAKIGKNILVIIGAFYSFKFICYFLKIKLGELNWFLLLVIMLAASLAIVRRISRSMKNTVTIVIIFMLILGCSPAHAEMVTSINVKGEQIILHMDNYGKRYDVAFGKGSNWSSALIFQVFAEKRLVRMRRDYQKDFWYIIEFKNFGLFYEFNDFISQNFQNLGECRNKGGDKCVSYVWFLP